MYQVAMTIGGERRDGQSTFASIDPYSGEQWAQVAEAGKDDVDDAVAAARKAFNEDWAPMPGRDRAQLMRKLAGRLTAAGEELAEYESKDNGKLLREMVGQLRGLPAWYEYYAGLADKIDGRVVDTGRSDYFGYVAREPVGVIASILPWNSPLLLLTFKLAPALAAGCTVVAKPSEHASVSIMRFAELFEAAGFPPGVFNTVSGASREVGAWLAAHPDVARVSFTGSDETGVKVAQTAATHLAPSTLELGGKSANIVFPDADPVAAANGIVAGIFAAAGQTCIAGSRALIHRSTYDDVLSLVTDRAARIKLGDPCDPKTEMGPICFEGQRDKVRGYIAEARSEGATIHYGGGDGGLGGLFMEPTIVTDVRNDSAVCREEIFGPVLSVIPFDNEDEALTLANDSRYGLAAGVWTNDLQRALRMSRALKVGTVWINSYRTLNYAMPFGGTKASGFGRENGVEGLHEYLEDKAVWIELSGATRDPFVLG